MRSFAPSALRMTNVIPSRRQGISSLRMALLLIFALITTASAKTWTTGYLSFDLPDNWKCGLDGSEFVCRPLGKVAEKEAIIVIAAKLPGKEDNLKAYYDFLKKPKQGHDLRGLAFSSHVNVIKHKEVKGTTWVDAIHLSSELRDFYTRYLATVKEGLAILVTYSVAKSKNSVYAADLVKMVESVQVLVPSQTPSRSIPSTPQH